MLIGVLISDQCLRVLISVLGTYRRTLMMMDAQVSCKRTLELVTSHPLLTAHASAKLAARLFCTNGCAQGMGAQVYPPGRKDSMDWGGLAGGCWCGWLGVGVGVGVGVSVWVCGCGCGCGCGCECVGVGVSVWVWV